MGMSQGNSLVAILNKQKNVILFLQNWRTGRQNRSYLRGWYQWEGAGGGDRL
jgi:hypothetical protein